MLVVDTNIVAYLLISGNRTADVRKLRRHDPDWRSDAFLLVELTNVFATCVRTGTITIGAAGSKLAEAETLFDRKLVWAPHAEVLLLAGKLGVSAYDARFLVAASALGTRLVTEDARLRTAAPKLTCSLDDALASG